MPWIPYPDQQHVIPDRLIYYYVPSFLPSISQPQSVGSVSIPNIRQNRSPGFPNEIYEQILHHLNYLHQPSLLNCLLTCKNFYQMGFRILNGKVIINPASQVDFRCTRKGSVFRRSFQPTPYGAERYQRKIDCIPSVEFLTVHSHRTSHCQTNSKEWNLAKARIHTLKIVLKPISSPYHRYESKSPRSRQKACHTLRGLRPTTVILDDFTIGLVKLDCQGVPISLYGETEEIILRCGPIPIDDRLMYEIQTFPTEGLARLKKLVIILSPRDASLLGLAQSVRRNDESMKLLATFFKNLPLSVSMIIVNLGGYSPGEAPGPASTWRIKPRNTPYDVGLAMGRLIFKDHPLKPILEISHEVRSSMRRMRFMTMEEYLWKENWYGVYDSNEVGRWIPYLTTPVGDTINSSVLHLQPTKVWPS
ncbi:hypothetical protein L486_03337 [Kwoniella mangroviensis CBS 10435]|uniref:F-box domain-containing protein n=1 Tax=Kwoniella mangroviensis CBS 10435 TaxID=1331196 RepID=A0A1B9ITI9_9TREE|nr:hypothetical protein L486_03337 [Kwoniella mangroviensis CBS 10435]